MQKSVIFLIEDEDRSRETLREELEQRYAANYQIVCVSSSRAAVRRLKALQAAGETVALMLAGCGLADQSGPEFLLQVRPIFPHAKRGLLVDWADPACADELIINAMALNKIDAFAAKPESGPAAPPNEEFHFFISQLLVEWARENRPQFEVFRIVGEQWARRSYELRDLLSRNSVPYTFFDVESEAGRDLLKQTQTENAPLPVVIFHNGEVLIDPSNAELAGMVGARTT